MIQNEIEKRKWKMSNKKYIVPEGMLNAAIEASPFRGPIVREGIKKGLEAALRWWSENSNGPTVEQVREFGGWAYGREDQIITGIAMWHRQMFLAPELVIPRWVSGAKCACGHSFDCHLDKKYQGRNLWETSKCLHCDCQHFTTSKLSEVAKRAIASFRGVTLSPEDADAIVDEIGHVAHGWSRYGEKGK
jgi:hypothetical protein